MRVVAVTLRSLAPHLIVTVSTTTERFAPLHRFDARDPLTATS